jgi:hypothetical protein
MNTVDHASKKGFTKVVKGCGGTATPGGRLDEHVSRGIELDWKP